MVHVVRVAHDEAVAAAVNAARDEAVLAQNLFRILQNLCVLLHNDDDEEGAAAYLLAVHDVRIGHHDFA